MRFLGFIIMFPQYDVRDICADLQKQLPKRDRERDREKEATCVILHWLSHIHRLAPFSSSTLPLSPVSLWKSTITTIMCWNMQSKSAIPAKIAIPQVIMRKSGPAEERQMPSETELHSGPHRNIILSGYSCGYSLVFSFSSLILLSSSDISSSAALMCVWCVLEDPGI